MRTPSKLKRHFNRPLRRLNVLGGFFFLLSASFFATAQPSSEKERHHAPPPEAFTACADANKEDACTIEAPHKTIQGTCRLDRRHKEKLLCVPNGAHRKHKRKAKEQHGDEAHETHPNPPSPHESTP